jgi:hypothetical protein
MIVTGMSSCLFCPSPESTFMNLDNLHFRQYFASAYSFLNRTPPFGQAFICSYVILSAQRSSCASNMLFGRTCSSGSRLSIIVNKPSKVSRLRLYYDFNAIICVGTMLCRRRSCRKRQLRLKLLVRDAEGTIHEASVLQHIRR